MRLYLIAFAALLASHFTAHADTLLYSYTTTASGEYYNGALYTSFTNSIVNITITEQSSFVPVTINGSSIIIPPLTIDVSGVGSLTEEGTNVDYLSLNELTNGNGVVVPDVLLNARFNDFRLEFTAPALAGLSLAMPFGPITGTTVNSTDNTFTGSAGNFIYLASEGPQSSFQVTDLSTPASVTPEPSSFVLLASGLSGLAFATKRRVRTRVASCTS